MSAMVPRHKFGKPGMVRPQGLLVMGVELSDAREEIFVRMVCDGIALGVAFVRAGFKSPHHDAPAKLFALPRIQERANAILEARRTTGVVTLPQVTEMLQRVFAGAQAAEEYSAAHSAAFSLARLYGHVTDRAVLEVRQPSRDPDAPSEQALASWVAGLPGPVIDAVPGPGPEALGPAAEASEPLEGRASGAPAGPQTPDPGPGPDFPSVFNGLDGMSHDGHEAGPSGPGGPGPENLNEIKGLAAGARGRPENGAPRAPVTGTPSTGARSASKPPGPINPRPRTKKRVLHPRVQVPAPAGVLKSRKKRNVKTVKNLPSAKDLFG